MAEGQNISSHRERVRAVRTLGSKEKTSEKQTTKSSPVDPNLAHIEYPSDSDESTDDEMPELISNEEEMAHATLRNYKTRRNFLSEGTQKYEKLVTEISPESFPESVVSETNKHNNDSVSVTEETN